MKRILLISLSLVAVTAFASCDEKMVTYDQLPASAKTFITSYFPEASVSYSSKDDDLVRPDYEVALSDGTRLEFTNSGELKKVSSRAGIPEAVIPDAIREYVQFHYPGTGYTEYEVDRRHYEVTLTNRLELKFNSNFVIVELDD